jgi:hypothetical protein
MEMTRIAAAFLIAASLGACSAPQSAHAFVDKTDRTEAYTILPNETAFWILDVGDNKTGQAKLDSEDYYNANKISMKRFIVPHHILKNSAGTAWYSGYDYFVPDGRLIIVSREPFSREWVTDATRGTASKDEGFHCQTKEGINVTVGMSAIASIKESDAAKYLYRFNVIAPQGERTDLNVIFQSVYYAKPLATIMDNVGRTHIQAGICREIMNKTLDEANLAASTILDTVTKDSTTYLNNMGITLEMLGYADTWTYDTIVQKAINDKYAAETLKTQVSTLQALAQVQVQEGLAAGVSSHGLPFVITPDLFNNVLGLTKVLPAAATGK